MRSHSARSTFICWRETAALREIVGVDSLVAARYEPLIRQTTPACGLDLTFVRDGRVAVIPFITVDAAMLIERELEPLVWPKAVADVLSDAIIDPITEAVLPWIESLTLSRAVSSELLRMFGDAASISIFESARRLGLLGAAPYASVVTSAAPYVYAARFAYGKRAAVRDPRGATGSAILARSARSIAADLGDERTNRTARQWFDRDCYGPIGEEPYDLLIAAGDLAVASGEYAVQIELDRQIPGTLDCAVVKPVPFDVMVSFDPGDGPIERRFSVAVEKPGLFREPRGVVQPRAEGGSGGRILLAARESWQRSDDADTDALRELAGRLRDEGFAADIVAAGEIADLPECDLLHILGQVRPDEMLALIERARTANIPCVVTPMAQDVAREALWGAAMVPVSYRVATDDVGIDEYLGALARRRLQADGMPGLGQEPFSGYTRTLGQALQLASVVLVSGSAEEAFIRDRYSVSGAIHAMSPYLNTLTMPEPIDAMAGTGDFILCHAPIETRCNQMLLARAAMQLKLPLVLAGPVCEADYYMLLREFCDESVAFLPDCTAGQINGLYRRARVYADVSWNSYGLHRIARAGVSGSALVVSDAGYAAALLGPGIWQADPASTESIKVAIGDAWSHVRESSVKIAETCGRIAAACDPVLSFKTIISAYAEAQSRTPVS
ncbi:MAG: hypothetical protein ABI182_05085 [Candidatus Baltobacteraceae bacterium]